MRFFPAVFLKSVGLWAGAMTCAGAEPAIVSQEKTTVEVGPFLSYEATITNHGDGAGTVTFGKPQWMAPMMNAAVDHAVNRTVDSLVEYSIRAVFSDEYHGPVVSGFYVPPEKADRFTTTDRDGRTTSLNMRSKMSQRVLEKTAR